MPAGGLRPPLSILEPVPGSEHPEDHAEANDKEQRHRAHAHLDCDITLSEEGPAEPADQIDYGIEKRDCLPRFRQHFERVECAAEECQRIDDEHRDHLELLEAL